MNLFQTIYGTASMDNEITIQKAEKADFDKVVLLEQSCLKETMGQDFYEDTLKTTTMVLLLAKQNQELVGLLSFYVVEQELEIINFCVKEENRRKHIGQQLFEQALEWYHPKKISLEVRESNVPAISLYTKMGLEKLSVRKKYYQDGENAIRMGKDIL